MFQCYLSVGVLGVEFLVGFTSKCIELDEFNLGVGNWLLMVVEIGHSDGEVDIFATRLV